jgi:hypothetical protein
MKPVGWVLVIALGYLVGYTISPSARVTAQLSQAAQPSPPVSHQPPEWKTTIPAPQLRQPTPIWPNQPQAASYWSVADIRKAHETLSEADDSGKRIDPNTTLHDFPYRTRTHAMFVSHKPGKTTVPNLAEEHAGYSQFVVVMGGTGTIQAGGELQKRSTLNDGGRTIPGEYRGPGITGGDTFKVKEGDWVSIPPDTPALVKADAGGLTYMVMKINTMLYPWELIK